MKLGPLHVIRDETFQKLHGLQELWVRVSGELAAASAAGNPLADRVLEQTHGLLHSPLGARFAPAVLPPDGPADDPGDRAAVERVVAAYRRATGDRFDPPTPSMWDRITSEKGDFLTALGRGDVPAVQRALARMFPTDLTWGLGQVHSSHPELLRSADPTHLHYRFTDTAVNLAEAVGAARVTSMGQDAAGHLRPLDRDLDALYEAAAARLGFDPSFPAVGGAFGFRLAGRLVTIDALTHAYTAYRLRQLDADTVFEIGGGYGCLALMANRAGVARYAIFDLPWVNALQGYFLLRTLPEGTVRLYGEDRGNVRVLPYWALAGEPEKSCDGVVNTDSLPEMGRATAAGYLPQIRRAARRFFLSINQEAKAGVPGVGEQNCVAELVEEAGGFAVLSRQRYWLRQGYVEEVYRPL